MFAFEVEYLLGRAFAGDYRDRSRPEWPPHPGRLFSALVAAYFEGGGHASERTALEWLEQQQPPCIRAGEPGDPNQTMAFVPTNYPGDDVPALRGKQPRFFPAQGPSEARVYFVWPNSAPDEATAAVLDSVAARTAYLGKAASLVRVRVTDSTPEPNYAPDPAGAHALRVPSRGRLQELKELYDSDRVPTVGAQQRYTKLDGPPPDQMVESEFGPMFILRRASGPGLPVEAAVTLTEAARRALLSVAGETGAISELLHGHGGGTHCAVVALPFVARPHADGHLMGFAVVLPRNASPADRRIVLAATAKLIDRELQIPGVGTWALQDVDATTPFLALRAPAWARPSRNWTSVTPVLLDRFPKKKGPSVEDVLTAACRRIGLPVPVDIKHGPYSTVEGVPPVPAFKLHRKLGDPPRWGVHATLTFAERVKGPVLLGAGRYFGLGLMRPLAAQTAEEHDDES